MLFNHMASFHSFNIGSPDNIGNDKIAGPLIWQYSCAVVFVDEYLDLLQSKLDR